MGDAFRQQKRDPAADEALALHVLRLAAPGESTPLGHIAARLGSSVSLASKVVQRLRARGVPVVRNRGSGGGYRLEETDGR